MQRGGIPGGACVVSLRLCRGFMQADPWVQGQMKTPASGTRLLLSLHLCAHTRAHGHACAQTHAHINRWTHQHACTQTCMHMITQGFGRPHSHGRSQPRRSRDVRLKPRASSARRGTPAARPHAWRGSRWVPPLLGNSSKFRPSLGHARLRNPAAQPVPATGGDPVPAELSPRAKPGPERVPGVPVTPGFPAPRGGTQHPTCCHYGSLGCVLPPQPALSA